MMSSDYTAAFAGKPLRETHKGKPPIEHSPYCARHCANNRWNQCALAGCTGRPTF